MFATAAGGFAMAFYVGDLAVLLSNMSIVRGELIVPLVVMLTMLKPNTVSPWAIFVGIVAGAASGAYFVFVRHDPSLGALSALLVPAAVCAISFAVRRRNVAHV